jgi:peptidoglycan/LPS O-acetylase OafA/YrhL
MKNFGSNTNREVQILRGLAVTLVVLYHLDSNVFSLGYLGVNIFFVISGFIVHEKILAIGGGLSFADSLFRLVEFLKKRFLRIFPGLSCLVIVSSILLAILIPMGKTQNRSLLLGISAQFGVSNFFAEKFAGDYFNASPNVFLHTWSLGVEIQFYVFFACLIFLTRAIFGPIKPRSRNIYLAFLSIILMASLYSFLELQAISSNQNVGYLMHHHAWEFILGIFAREFLERQELRLKIPYLRAMILFAVLLTLWTSATQLHIHMLVVMATGILLASGVRFTHLRNLLDFFHLAGDRSYSIYLWHFPFLVLAKHSPVTAISSSNRVAPSIIAIVLTYVLSELSYKFIEEKFR